MKSLVLISIGQSKHKLPETFLVFLVKGVIGLAKSLIIKETTFQKIYLIQFEVKKGFKVVTETVTSNYHTL